MENCNVSIRGNGQKIKRRRVNELYSDGKEKFMDAIDTYMTAGSLCIAVAAGLWEKGFIFVPIALCVSAATFIGLAIKENLRERRTQWKRRK